MSAEDLTLVDNRTWSHHSDDDTGRTRASERVEDDAGAWPEEMPDVRVYADSSLTLPGMGDKPAGCGEWLPMEFCDSCADVKLGSTSCQTRQCPDCWYSWDLNRTTGIVERMGAAREAAEKPIEKRAVHCIASAPVGSVKTLVDIKQGWRDAYDLASEKGIRGGVVVFHGYRVRDEAKETFRELKEADLVEGGIWQWVREHDRSWRSLTYWSPHWHILGLAEDVGENDPENDDGWVFKRLSTLTRWKMTDEDGYEAMAKVSTYLLSHLTFNPDGGSHAIRWFGDLANNQFSPESALSNGRWAAIQRITREVVGGPTDPDDMEVDEDGHLVEPDDERTCDCEECNGSLSPIWDAGAALCDPGWCERIGRDAERRLDVAFRWAIGEIHGPPGMKFADTEDGAEELYEWLLAEHG
ncbi:MULTISPECIES: hypothetical protein [Bacteria]|uniref:hypothetical protein n=1 Tax=Bacteria TaxID=2 RepID=UPI0018A7A52F|nr:hypothetical protein [Halomonas sp. 328]MBF8224503.1 hypothetical protein [Halomonas sp. 328]